MTVFLRIKVVTTNVLSPNQFAENAFKFAIRNTRKIEEKMIQFIDNVNLIEINHIVKNIVKVTNFTLSQKGKSKKLEYFTSLDVRLKHMCSASKRRAEKRGMEFDLTPSILFVMAHFQEMKCSVTGIPFDLSLHVDYHKNPYGISIDRKDSNKGYTISNVQLVCTWYNMMKNEWSDEDVKKLIKIAYETLFKGEK